jgi:hypothetical protein
MWVKEGKFTARSGEVGVSLHLIDGSSSKVAVVLRCAEVAARHSGEPKTAADGGSSLSSDGGGYCWWGTEEGSSLWSPRWGRRESAADAWRAQQRRHGTATRVRSRRLWDLRSLARLAVPNKLNPRHELTQKSFFFRKRVLWGRTFTGVEHLPFNLILNSSYTSTEEKVGSEIFRSMGASQGN